MAHKSKTQRAKAAAAKANKRDRQMREEAAGVAEKSEESTETVANASRTEKKEAKKQAVVTSKKEEKPKKVRFQFLHDVRAEMKRVTWPSRTDVMRWSGVVIGALVFFGVYVAILDSAISEGLFLLSGLRG